MDDDDSDSDHHPFDEEEIEWKMKWKNKYLLGKMKENDPDAFYTLTDNMLPTNMTDEEWEELGRDASNNTLLEIVEFSDISLDDSFKLSFFFRGLTSSSSIEQMNLFQNEFSIAGVRSMVPFLQNATNLREMDLDCNNFQSEGFNALFRALSNSPIEMLECCNCGIESIEIHTEHVPKHLTVLRLNENGIDADGCRELAKLLQGGDSTLNKLHVDENKIDDEGVAILVDALQNNTSLQILDLMLNQGITAEGMKMFLKLVNDVSSIKATLQSNRTLQELNFNYQNDMQIKQHINMATHINAKNENDAEAAGQEKVIETQLHSVKRAELARLQGVTRSFYSEINPLHLPEVLSLIGRHHGQGELYLALKSSIMTLFSTMNMKKCIHQERAYHAAIVAKHAGIVAEHRNKMEELDAKLASMDEAVEVNEGSNELEHRSNKRRRKWWWGLWGGA